MIQGLDGNLYGTAYTGGAVYGQVFRLSPSGEVTDVHTFIDSDGAFPAAALVLDGNGALLGTASTGGAYAGGSVFRIVPEVSMSVWGIAPSSVRASETGEFHTNFVVGGFHFDFGATLTVAGTLAPSAVVQNEFVMDAQVPVLAAGTLNDITVTNPNSLSATLARALFVDFDDVEQFDPFHGAVEGILRAGITAGCGGGLYCRDASVTRARWPSSLKAKFGPAYVPPPRPEMSLRRPGGWLRGRVDRGCCRARHHRRLRRRQLLPGRAGHAGADGGAAPEDEPGLLLRAAARLGDRFRGRFRGRVCRGLDRRPRRARNPRGLQHRATAVLPGEPDTRGQMAVFLSRIFDLP